MPIQGHVGIFLIATVVWVGFWIAGLPFYYQQYSRPFMIWFELAPVWWTPGLGW